MATIPRNEAQLKLSPIMSRTQLGDKTDPALLLTTQETPSDSRLQVNHQKDMKEFQHR